MSQVIGVGDNEVKYFTKELLIEANNAAIREKRNRALSEEFLEGLPDDRPYVIFHSFFHHKDEMRVMFNFKEGVGYLDMSMLRYDSIPIGKISDDNCVIPEDPEVTKTKRPYSDGREWQETITKKPVRKQYNFRKEVLRAYSNQCAVCSVNNPKILRAAHILPVVMSSDDTVNNGICLCTNHEIAFDENELKIKPNGDVVIDENSGIRVEYDRIRYPEDNEDYPSEKKLEIRYYNFEELKL